MTDRPGYNYDGCTPEVVLHRMTAENGLLTLPDGMTYRALVLPDPVSKPGQPPMPGAGTMTPQLLKKITELVSAGATVIGPRPTRSPSLDNYPDCDKQFAALAEALWGPCDGIAVKENRVGKGKIVCGLAPEDALRKSGLQLDFACSGNPAPVRYTHRRAGEGIEIYFVANKNSDDINTVCTFRVDGRRPELWWPETGRVEHPGVYTESNGRISLPLHLDSAQSVFVLFRPDSALEPDRVVAISKDGSDLSPDSIRITRDEAGLVGTALASGDYHFQFADGKTVGRAVAPLPRPISIDGAWNLTFPPKLGAPPSVHLDHLISWSGHPDPGVRYFSGTATYDKFFDLTPATPPNDSRIYLDLGRVEVMAHVVLNGKDLGILWKPPYRVEITGTVIAGKNHLEIQVANLWPNRLLGDEQFPPDAEWSKAFLAKWPPWLLAGQPSPAGRISFTTYRAWFKDSPLQPSGLIGPVRIDFAQTIRLP